MRFAMRVLSPVLLAMACVAAPVWAADSDTFDPEQPFNALHGRLLLESLAGHALELLRDHVEISTDASSGDDRSGERPSLRFKFYPDGKSKSDHYFAAEGWLGPSPDALRQELHFRFSLPDSVMKRSPETSGRSQPGNVL